MGCIAVELFLGLPIFPGSSEFDQITRIVDVFGVPPLFILRHGRTSRKFFQEEFDEGEIGIEDDSASSVSTEVAGSPVREDGQQPITFHELEAALHTFSRT